MGKGKKIILSFRDLVKENQKLFTELKNLIWLKELSHIEVCNFVGSLIKEYKKFEFF